MRKKDRICQFMTIEEKKLEFQRDVEARRTWWKMMNYHYLMYKGISILSHAYSKEILESLGLQIHIPRTFMTIEAIRPDLDKPMDIIAKWQNRKEKPQARRVSYMLKGEWKRSESDKEKAKAEFDALLYGSGYLLSYYEKDEEEMDILVNYDIDGRPVYKKGKQKNYEGMRIKWLDPYYVIPDRKAKTYEHGYHTSPRRIWIPSIWDYDVWMEYAKKKGYKTEGIKKAGQIEEYDSVRRTIDALYVRTLTDLKTRDGGVLITPQQESPTTIQDENALLVITEYTPKEMNIYAGQDWIECHSGKNPSPRKQIPIFCLKDYDIPGELEGVGEAEVLRWQQYEENKIHNLMYLQVILNTVKRYGIVEELLADPTEVKMSNPLKPIRLKYFAGVKVNDAVQQLDQSSVNEVPLAVLREVKTIGQMATGQSDYLIGASKGEAGTLGEAEMMNVAGGKRVKEKIQQMEEYGIVPILKMWLASIPQLYTEELDYLLTDGTNKEVKFLPFNRDLNKNATLVAKYGVREGVMNVATLEDVFLQKGYIGVVFVSDLIGSYDITIKTALAFLDKNNMIKQYQGAIAIAMTDNNNLIAMGRPPKWDISKLTEDLLRQFGDIIEDVLEYELPQQPMGGVQMPTSVSPTASPSAIPNQLEETTII